MAMTLTVTSLMIVIVSKPTRHIELTSKPPSSPRLHSLSSPGNKEDKVDYEKNGGSTELIFFINICRHLKASEGLPPTTLQAEKEILFCES